MKRKAFINSILPLGLSVAGVTKVHAGILEIPESVYQQVPPYLRNEDTIGITCPGGYITMDDVQPAVNKLKEWGYQVKPGSTVGKKDFGFGGTDEERAADLQQMLDDPGINAILCARGGYGTVRIIDKLDFSKFLKKPKWIIGFSDITVLHCHVNRQFGIASIHSKMCNSFPADWTHAEPVQVESIESIRDCLAGKKMVYKAVPNLQNKNGIAEGLLVGGNLKTIESLSGSSSDIITDHKILFVEDTGEYLYSIDRMFWNLKRTGKLSKLKGLIIGGFKAKKDDPGEEFGKTLEEIVLEKVKEYQYPVCFDFPVGHQKYNMALKCGITHRLEVSESSVSLDEIV